MGNIITHQEAHRLFSYSNETGELIWRISPRNSVPVHTIAGSRKSGYVKIKINRKLFLAHRIVWLMFNGSMPKNEIDHINRNRCDNRIQNLREATHSQNGKNVRKKTNKSGFHGVSARKDTPNWCAQITVDGKKTHIGMYKTKEEAARAYDAKASECFGQFAQLNFIKVDELARLDAMKHKGCYEL